MYSDGKRADTDVVIWLGVHPRDSGSYGKELENILLPLPGLTGMVTRDAALRTCGKKGCVSRKRVRKTQP